MKLSELEPRFSMLFLLQDMLLFVRLSVGWAAAADMTAPVPFKVRITGCKLRTRAVVVFAVLVSHSSRRRRLFLWLLGQS